MRNLTHLAPSFDDLYLLPHRAAERAKAFAFYYGLDDIFGRIRGPGAFIAENTANKSNVSASLTKKALARATGGSVAEIAASRAASPGAGISSVAAVTSGTSGAFTQGAGDTGMGRFVNVTWQPWKSLGGVLPYILSKWAMMTLLMTFVVNRTQFYASSRVPINLWWPVRLGVFLVPILAVGVQISWLVRGIRCQTSPDYAILRYGNASKTFDMDYAGEGGLLYGLTSALLFWESDAVSCANVQMGSRNDSIRTAGSLSLLWPLFLSLCVGAFTDTLASALQGRATLSDFNLLELSFAFNEAESMVLRVYEAAITAASSDDGGDAGTFDRKILLRAVNTSPDMLFIALIWACSSVTSMILAIFGRRHRYRLLNTGIWGIAYFAAITRSIYHMWLAFPDKDSLWTGRIPMILLMGFVPHFVVITGMVTCALIYGAALLMTMFSVPVAHGEASTLGDRLSLAYRNLQANVHFSNSSPLNFKMSDDFYTALLNAGFSILTAASEAVYLNEGAKVRVSNLTWLERKRTQELHQGLLFKKTRQAIPSNLRAAINDRVEVAMGNPQPSGYGVERKIRGQDKEEALAVVKGSDNLPIPRNGRHYMAMRLIAGTFWLILGFQAKTMLLSLELCGIQWRPRFLTRLIGPRKGREVPDKSYEMRAKRDHWIRPVGYDENTDVEHEFKKQPWSDDVDGDLYEWWRSGGYFSEVDTSGDYAPTQRDDDLTSMLSMSSNVDQNDDWEDEDDGRRTPTQRTPFPSSREATPFEYDGALDAQQLSMLLDPKTAEQQHEARLLAHRLRHGGGIVTRSRYNRDVLNERAAVLASSRYGQRLTLSSNGTLLSPEEEERALEEFMLSRRKYASQTLKTSDIDDDWATGAAGMGSGGPQCVVCQDSPRTVLLWPCGCLCLCDDCRVTMAAKNFGSCVCCRTGTLAYSRLYVP